MSHDPDPDPAETTELRWFGDGSLPGDVESWFTASGTVGTVELRTDAYRVGGRSDVGVKRRSGTALELKVRHRVEDPLAVGSGLIGRTETWEKWSPTSTDDANGADLPWIAVRKRIVKRLFSDDGDERPFSYDARAAMAAGCDVEVAEVTVGDTWAWTLAFAAFGPTSTRRGAILACWRELGRGQPIPEHLSARLSTSASYPVWLDRSEAASRT